jgi:hypothetical protein
VNGTPKDTKFVHALLKERNIFPRRHGMMLFNPPWRARTCGFSPVAAACNLSACTSAESYMYTCRLSHMAHASLGKIALSPMVLLISSLHTARRWQAAKGPRVGPCDVSYRGQRLRLEYRMLAREKCGMYNPLRGCVSTGEPPSLLTASGAPLPRDMRLRRFS